jgi:hypothetical protein
MMSYNSIDSTTNFLLQNKAVDYVPQITYHEEDGLLRMEGESYHEYAVEFFQPTFEWLANYMTKRPKQKITLEFKMTYFNTSTSRRFLEMFFMLEDYQRKGGQAEVRWFYEVGDLDMLDSGMEYAKEVTYPMHMIPYEENL